MTLRRGDARDLAERAAEAIEVYTQAMRRSPQVAMHRRAMLDEHLRRPGLVCALAESDRGDLLGFAYSYPGSPGDWWYDSVFRALGERAAEWLTDCVEVVELHVQPSCQGNGHGRALLRLLLDAAVARTAVLSTHDKESAARWLYRSFGFVDLLTDYRFPGGTERFAVMGARLDG